MSPSADTNAKLAELSEHDRETFDRVTDIVLCSLHAAGIRIDSASLGRIENVVITEIAMYRVDNPN